MKEGKGRKKRRARAGAGRSASEAIRRPKAATTLPAKRRRPDWHRGAVGGLWDQMGELQIDYLKRQGLLPEHCLLDVGCGSLRGGVRFVDYLEPGHYFGLDISQELLDAGVNELAQLDLLWKRPQLRCSDSFEVDAFGREFDFALAQSLFTHLTLNKIAVCLLKVADVLRPAGRFYATFFENPRGTRNLGAVRQPAEEWTEKRDRWSFPDEDPYHYGRDAFEWLCEGSTLDVEYIGDWGHPRNQMMLCFRKAERT